MDVRDGGGDASRRGRGAGAGPALPGLRGRRDAVRVTGRAALAVHRSRERLHPQSSCSGPFSRHSRSAAEGCWPTVHAAPRNWPSKPLSRAGRAGTGFGRSWRRPAPPGHRPRPRVEDREQQARGGQRHPEQLEPGRQPAQHRDAEERRHRRRERRQRRGPHPAPAQGRSAARHPLPRGGRPPAGRRPRPADAGAADHDLRRRPARLRGRGAPGDRHRQRAHDHPRARGQGRARPLRHALAPAARDPARPLAPHPLTALAVPRP